MDQVGALMGKTMNGGGRKKVVKKTTKKPVNKNGKRTGKRPSRKVFGFFGGNNDKFELKNCSCSCDKIEVPKVNVVPTQKLEVIPAVVQDVVSVNKPAIQSNQEIKGGAMGMKKSTYKKYLDGLTVERLHKVASSKGIKITKKKDGKTTYVKKATLVKKLCEFKYGK